MRQITIDCAFLEHPRQLHKALAAELHFPEWYGNNLDALHDCLTAITEETTLLLLHFDHLSPFTKGFRRVFQDAQAETPLLHITLL